MTLTALLFPLVSHHFDPPVPKDYNEVHPGIIAEIDHAWLVGVYRNSHRNHSVVALRRLDLGNYGSGAVEAGVAVGLCTGYRSPVCGYVGVRLADRVEISFTPRVSNYNAHTFAIAWRQPL